MHERVWGYSRHAQDNASSASKRVCGFFLCTAAAACAMAPVGPSCSLEQ